MNRFVFSQSNKRRSLFAASVLGVLGVVSSAEAIRPAPEVPILPIEAPGAWKTVLRVAMPSQVPEQFLLEARRSVTDIGCEQDLVQRLNEMAVAGPTFDDAARIYEQHRAGPTCVRSWTGSGSHAFRTPFLRTLHLVMAGRLMQLAASVTAQPAASALLCRVRTMPLAEETVGSAGSLGPANCEPNTVRTLLLSGLQRTWSATLWSAVQPRANDRACAFRGRPCATPRR